MSIAVVARRRYSNHRGQVGFKQGVASHAMPWAGSDCAQCRSLQARSTGQATAAARQEAAVVGPAEEAMWQVATGQIELCSIPLTLLLTTMSNGVLGPWILQQALPQVLLSISSLEDQMEWLHKLYV